MCIRDSTYTISDGQGGTSTGNVNVTVTAVNDDPVANDDSATVNEDESVIVEVLTNDSDIDGDTISVDSFTQGASGTVTDNGDGTLTYAPNADFNGSDSFTYTISDGQGGANTATVNVTVNPINDTPTLDTIADITINEDATEQTLNLAGASAGGGESQPLQITASSSDTNLVPNPTITFTEANPNDATLSFTPVADQSGRATIIVEIEDGGLDGDLNTAGDNATFTRTFDVNISPVNDSPTLDVIVDVTLDEDAAEQTINLAGATAGGGETQPLQITASSSNNTLIPDPVVTYTTPDETGSLAFTPVADQNGTATITVTVEDGGLDGDLNTAGDNATFSRTFEITVNAEELIPGDSNRDGFFDSTDLVQVFQAGEYEDGIPLNSTWETGD